jgi:hypothetical protein
MSGFGYCNPVAGRDKSNWDLAAVMKGLAGHVGSRSWTCSVNGTGIWQWTQISLDKLKKMSSPDMSGMGLDMSGLGYWNPVRQAEMSSFLGRLGSNIFFDD